MIHSSNKGAKVSEQSFNLRGECKLPFSVDVSVVLHWPPTINPLIYSTAVGLQARAWLNVLEQEVSGITLVHGGLLHHLPGEIPGTHLLSEQQGELAEVCLIHLHRALQNMLYVRHLEPKLPKPESHRGFTEMAQFLALQDWYRLRPAPEQTPPRPQR